MDNKIVKLSEVKKSHKVQKNEVNATTNTGYDFVEIILSELNCLATSLDITTEEALNMIKDFYKKYPMSLEYVRSPEVLLYKEKLTLEKLIK